MNIKRDTAFAVSRLLLFCEFRHLFRSVRMACMKDLQMKEDIIF